MRAVEIALLSEQAKSAVLASSLDAALAASTTVELDSILAEVSVAQVELVAVEAELATARTELESTPFSSIQIDDQSVKGNNVTLAALAGGGPLHLAARQRAEDLRERLDVVRIEVFDLQLRLVILDTSPGLALVELPAVDFEILTAPNEIPFASLSIPT